MIQIVIALCIALGIRFEYVESAKTTHYVIELGGVNCEPCCDGWTATMTPATPGIVAACAPGRLGQMVYINGTRSVVNIGKIVKIPGTYGPDGHEITPPVYYDGWAYDIMSEDVIDFGENEVYPGDSAAHSFFGWPRGAEVPKPTPPIEEEVISE